MAIFIALVTIYGYLLVKFDKSDWYRRQAVLGFSFGIFAIGCMYAKIPVFEGVIVDQTMPDMIGAQLAKELIALRPDLPIMMYTGYSSNIDADKANIVGIKAFIMKPIDNQKLASTVRRLLEAS